mmetsp:Transcript_75821/g.245498  ORF Transcript_75821/g.245498 Transcript_75821/m.245498 type:complete len:227 (-) Transcript_75821:678-1358(-)
MVRLAPRKPARALRPEALKASQDFAGRVHASALCDSGLHAIQGQARGCLWSAMTWLWEIGTRGRACRSTPLRSTSLAGSQKRCCLSSQWQGSRREQYSTSLRSCGALPVAGSGQRTSASASKSWAAIAHSWCGRAPSAGSWSRRPLSLGSATPTEAGASAPKRLTRCLASSGRTLRRGLQHGRPWMASSRLSSRTLGGASDSAPSPPGSRCWTSWPWAPARSWSRP